MRRRRMTALALAIGCAALAAALTPTLHARTHRPARAIAGLYCESEYEDALREAKKFRGDERCNAEATAKQRRDACRKKAREALQFEDVMPRLFPR